MNGQANSDLVTKHVLLIEDSSVTKDLVELVLGQAGHSVVCAETGQAALRALMADDFDVVLADFHLPDISGLEVVRRFDANRGTRPRPVFIAITGDTRGLLADNENCELFDQVVPKPLDVDVVCVLVEQSTQSMPVPVASRRASGDGLDLAVLRWPLEGGPAPAPGLAGFDAIRIEERRELETLWRMRGTSTLPILDATGSMGPSADIDVSRLTLAQVEDVRRIVEQFHERRADLHPDLLRSDEPTDRLLTRIAVSGVGLQARLSHLHEGMVAWNTICDPNTIPDLLRKLSSESLIELEFFDRVHVCPGCQSARVIVREECPACRSTQLIEEPYLHHFRCATQAPESRFQQGDDLFCPKCNRELHNFGRDYDRPGILSRCESCGETLSEPQVAFACTRCNTRTLAEAMPVQDIHSASLTEAGQSYLRAGASFLGPARRTLKFGDFPLELVVALNKSAAAYNDGRTPFTLASVHYDGLEEIRIAQGALRARESRRLWLEAMRQSLGSKALFANGMGGDFILLAGMSPDEAPALLDPVRDAADRTVRDELRADLRMFGPGDLAR